MSAPPRLLTAFANAVVARPGRTLVILLLLGALGGWGTSRLTINANQLDLISQDLPEVRDVKRIIDMVGGSGYLMLALRSDEEARMKGTADDLAELLQADRENVRFVTYKTPVEFIQENMVLFVETPDLQEGRRRIMTYLRERIRRASPLYFELRPTPEPELKLDDLRDKYSRVGKKTILDDYYISGDRQMVIMLIKPMWDTNDLGKTKRYIDKLEVDLAHYSRDNAHGVHLVQDYAQVGRAGTIAYGYTGSYKTALDDSYAIAESLEPVSTLAFSAILCITVLFFRKWLPSLIVLTGMVLGTILAMGFTYATVGTLNMITSILGGIMMGFGVDYGIHFVFRTRIELGLGKPYELAIRDALVNAGRPAGVSAVVTGGSFLVLLISEFRGFSQFGFLAGCGTVIIGVTMFCWSAACLVLLGRINPEWPRRFIGVMHLPRIAPGQAQGRVPNPRRLLAVAVLVVLAVCLFAVPWAPVEVPLGQGLSWSQRLGAGVRFNYNTRALMPEDQVSVQLQDEINRRFQISSDPIAVYTRTLPEARAVYAELTEHPDKYSAIDQVVSIFSFVPPPARAQANAAILAEWRDELDAMQFNAALLPSAYQDKMPLIDKILHAKPYGIDALPEIYATQFRNLPTTQPENQGLLTFIYPKVDLWDGKQLLVFAQQVRTIETADGQVFRGAGSATLYAKLARIVLWDGKVTVLLTALWILLMHFLDFRNVTLALASVLPLGVGLLMMLGLMGLTDHALNFMNIITLPILLGFGVSHGLYLLHRFLEGTSPVVALRSVGAAVASSTLTAIAGFGALFAASHNGLKSMGYVACLGLTTTLLVSFTVLAAVLQILDDRQARARGEAPRS